MELQLLLTGDELMAGDTIDSNSAMIAKALQPMGIRIHRRVTVGDDTQQLADEIAFISKTADVLIVNGGLGPTVDDLTAEVLAKVADEPICENPDALAHLQHWSNERGYPLNKANLKQAQLPQSCQVIPNATGSAVGFWQRINNCIVICTPGVPSELRNMINPHITELIGRHFKIENKTSTQRFRLFGIGESTLQEVITTKLPEWPSEVGLGFRANMPIVEVKLTITDQAHTNLQQQCAKDIKALFGDAILGEGDITLAEALLDALNSKQQTVTFAESCTGGQIAAEMTKVAGSSAVFKGSFVTYSNELKQNFLGVSEDTLKSDGAVSQATVEQMAAGALKAAHSDWVVAVSGVAGPGGGSDDKPVGTIWLAWGNAEQIRSTHLFIPGQRQFIQTLVTALALDLVRRGALGLEAEPQYLRQRAANR